MLQPGRSAPANASLAGGYRYGYNGKEKDNNGEFGLTNYDYGFRIFNPGLGRFLSVDPHEYSYPNISSFVFALNNPIAAVDDDGRDVHIVIGNKPMGTTRIRLVAARSLRGSIPVTVEVKYYNMTVTDDVTGKTSVYFVTRDAPELSRIHESILPFGFGDEFDVINTSFEPRGNNKYKTVSTEVDALGAYALRTQKGSENLPAQPNDSPHRKRGKNIAYGVQIHVGGTFKYKGETMESGSEGCFTCTKKDAGNEGITNFVEDVESRRAENRKAGKGSRLDVTIKKRSGVELKWRVDRDGEKVK